MRDHNIWHKILDYQILDIVERVCDDQHAADVESVSPLDVVGD